MELELKVHAQLQQLAHFFHTDKQFDPLLVISTTWSGKAKEVEVHYADWLKPINVKLVPPKQPGLLLLSVFTTITYSRGVHCRLHAATGVIDVHNIRDDGIATAPVANYRAGATFAPFTISVQEYSVPDGYKDPGPYKETNLATLGGQIQADLSMFADMTPADPFLLKCHVPVYRIANQVLPGAAYFSTHNTVDISHQWFVHMSAQVAARHGTTTAQWTRNIKNQFEDPPRNARGEYYVREEFHEAVGMALEIATAAVQSYEYVVDFFVNASGAKEMYESFDNYFVRRCGDCEGKLPSSFREQKMCG